MIEAVGGRVREKGEGWVVIEVGGVGLRVECSARTLAALEAGREAELTTEMFVQDERIRLYGFADGEERQWFLLLLGVQGIGARMALGLLGMMAPAELSQALAAGDAVRLTCAPGIGARLARRIATELKDKAPQAAAAVAIPDDALAALVRLGYGRMEASRVLAQVVREMRLDDVGELVRHSLRLLR